MPDNEDKKPQVVPKKDIQVSYPANNKKSKAEAEKGEPEKKVIEKIEGVTVVVQKPKFLRRVRAAFTGDDARSVLDYLIFEVAVPAFKNVISDMTSQGVDRILFGGSTERRGAGNRRPGHVSYHTLNRNAQDRGGRNSTYTMTNQDKASHSFDNIVLSTRPEAEKVLAQMLDTIEQYNMIAVSDLYEMLDIVGSFADDRWGWYDLSGADIVRVRDGWVLDLPPTRVLR